MQHSEHVMRARALAGAPVVPGLFAAAVLALLPGVPAAGAAAAPGPSTTGVPAGTALTPSGPLVITEDGAVVEGLDVDGCVQIRADDVVLRNSRIRCSRGPGESRAHAIDADGSDVLIEDVEISGEGDPWTMGVMGSKVTVRRADIHSVGDGIKAGSFSTYEGNYIHDLADGDDQHNDGIQMSGGRDTVIRGNRIVHRPEQTSAILLKADLGVIENVTIESNWLEGGNYTLYAIGQGPSPRANGSETPYATRSVLVRSNRFSTSYGQGVLLTRNVPDLVWAGNVWEHSGAPIGSIGPDGTAPAQPTPAAPSAAASAAAPSPQVAEAQPAQRAPTSQGERTPHAPAGGQPDDASGGSGTDDSTAPGAAGTGRAQDNPGDTAPDEPVGRGPVAVAVAAVVLAGALALRETRNRRGGPRREPREEPS